MALNAMAYPIMVRAYSIFREVIAQRESSGKATSATSPEQCENGGTYQEIINVESEDGNATDITFIYHECNTTDPNGSYQDPMIEKCLQIGVPVLTATSSSSSSPKTASATANGDYYAVMDGTVRCYREEDNLTAHALLENYVVHAYNSTLQDPPGDNEWKYDMNITLKKVPAEEQSDGNLEDGIYTLAIDGYLYGKKWDQNGTIVNDETWAMNDFILEGIHRGAVNEDTITARGEVSYHGSTREGDVENPSMDLSLAFDDFSYTMLYIDKFDVNVTISGSLKASCYPATVSYTTTQTLVDDNRILDADGRRMPSQGSMKLKTSRTSGSATAQFNSVVDPDRSLSEKATVEITDFQGNTETYSSWREIVEGSSCEIIQEILDRNLPLLPFPLFSEE
jgi:hypothetical protein